MKRIVNAIEKGRCVLAVAGAQLRDPSVMLALTERSALPAVALSGPAVAPVRAITVDALARSIGQQGGVIAVVEPQNEDLPGLQKLAELVQRAPHKPTFLIVARSFNPFVFAGALRDVKWEHIKGRGQLFVRDLPVPPEVEALPTVEVAKEVVQKKKTGPEAPRLAFVGRDEEVETLKGLLAEGGPVVVSGPPGVGRTWLVEHTLEACEGLTRMPDVDLAYGTGFDVLAAMLAEVTRAGGSEILAEALKNPQSKPLELVEAAQKALAEAEGNAGHVLVVRGLHYALGRRGDFFRKSRLELLLEVLLTTRYPLRLVFLSNQQPVFFREAHNQAVRRLELEGLKGRFFHEIFQAYSAPEFPRDKFGPIAERTHGHPLAARAYAIEVRERQDGLEILDNPKFLKADDLGDLRALKKRLGRRLEKLARPVRESLSVAAHVRAALPGKVLAELGVSRKDRNELLSLGMLEFVGTATGTKRYRVHPLVRSLLAFREITDFDVLRHAAQVFRARFEAAEGPEKVFWGHQCNRAAELGRQGKSKVQLPYPDNDTILDGVVGLIHRQNPRLDLAAQQAGFVLNRHAGNADAHLLKLQVLDREGAKAPALSEAFAKALAEAPVPELYHQAVNWNLRGKARGKAIELLEEAVGLLPSHSRLHTRLAALLLAQGRRPEAITHLETAMHLDPQLPDAYGILGMARYDEGGDALTAAEELLREAVRLAPDDAVQVSRLVTLLTARARVADAEVRTALRAEARELLEGVLAVDKKAAEIQLQLATLVREETGDVERARWLLERALKGTDRRSDRRLRIRLEAANLDLLEGKLDAAEKDLRELAAKDPSNAQVFASLARVLVARELYIPAHAEFMRARERTAPNSLARREFEAELAGLQALIESQAAQLVEAAEVEAAEVEAAPAVTEAAEVPADEAAV